MALVITVDTCVLCRTGIQVNEASEGELAAFTAYGCAFPNKFLCLVDTYDVLRYVTFQATSQYVDAACCYRQSSVVCRSVCLS